MQRWHRKLVRWMQIILLLISWWRDCTFTHPSSRIIICELSWAKYACDICILVWLICPLYLPRSTPVGFGANGLITPLEAVSTHVNPFPGANIDPRSLEVTGIDVDNPLRGALDEREALELIFIPIRKAMKTFGCKRAILVGHNAHFDLNFLNAALRRTGHKKSPFHTFSVMDTVTLAGIFYCQTVLAKSLWAAGLEWDPSQAHSALYDASRTAELFCLTINRLRTISEASASLAVVPAGVEPIDAEDVEDNVKAEADLE